MFQDTPETNYITSININSKRQIKTVLAEAFKTLRDEYGIEVKLGHETSSDLIMKSTFEFAVAHDRNGKEINAEKEQYERIAAYMPQVEKDWYGKVFQDNTGKSYYVYKLFPNRPKNCVGIREVSGRKKGYVCKPSFVRINMR